MIIPNNLYDILKKVITIYVPALVTLLTSLTMIWNWNIPIEAIVATISAITTFIGVCLGISTSNYNKMVEELEKAADAEK